MGRVNTNIDVQADRALLRGGNWGDALYAGVLAANLYYNTDYSNFYDGFRCAR